MTTTDLPGAGRPRDMIAAQAILDATVALLPTLGYPALSIEAIARRAGVGKATIYRWWGSKALLVYEAVFTGAEATPLPDTGNLADDLRFVLERLVAEFAAPVAASALPGLLADVGADPELRAQIEARFLQPAYAHIAALFERAVARGEINPDLPFTLILDTLTGLVLYRALLARPPLSPKEIAALVTLLLHGITRP